MDLKPSFNRTDVKENLPIEFKKFILAEQIWKLIMKIALSKPLVRFHLSIKITYNIYVIQIGNIL